MKQYLFWLGDEEGEEFYVLIQTDNFSRAVKRLLSLYEGCSVEYWKETQSLIVHHTL
jgi:hypothetical protein